MSTMGIVREAKIDIATLLDLPAAQGIIEQYSYDMAVIPPGVNGHEMLDYVSVTGAITTISGASYAIPVRLSNIGARDRFTFEVTTAVVGTAIDAALYRAIEHPTEAGRPVVGTKIVGSTGSVATTSTGFKDIVLTTPYTASLDDTYKGIWYMVVYVTGGAPLLRASTESSVPGVSGTTWPVGSAGYMCYYQTGGVGLPASWGASYLPYNLSPRIGMKRSS